MEGTTVFIPSKQQHKTRRVTATVDGDELALWYRPAAVTPAALESLTGGTDAENVGHLVDLVTTLVADWEIAEPVMNGHTDADGNVLQARDADGNLVWQKWPVDRPHASRLAFNVLNAIVGAIGDDLSPGESNASGS